jgi:hypothetical protein
VLDDRRIKQARSRRRFDERIFCNLQRRHRGVDDLAERHRLPEQIEMKKPTKGCRCNNQTHRFGVGGVDVVMQVNLHDAPSRGRFDLESIPVKPGSAQKHFQWFRLCPELGAETKPSSWAQLSASFGMKSVRSNTQERVFFKCTIHRKASKERGILCLSFD